MLYSAVCLIVATIRAVVMKKAKADAVYSNDVLIPLLCARITTTSLSQNYTQSLFPEANDGTGRATETVY
ncbi:hypothetical protein [Paenibacillus chitinolyticus]|uniref:hypothetical protein n=1 Tax=Paenibacillus chitinolyticus TaxID=79263 RepID=UPI001C44EC82|nr:hypothetical protein [Paenibacillus chitinolyticus]MBV6715042.1 hypothetical protein [Paenibacillus chitinolyticus]